MLKADALEELPQAKFSLQEGLLSLSEKKDRHKPWRDWEQIYCLEIPKFTFSKATVGWLI